jgi:hypothetical protein
MGFSLGSLVQTAGQAVEKRRDLQRQREKDILQRALVNAQIAELQQRHQSATNPAAGFTLPQGAKRYDANGHEIANNPPKQPTQKPTLTPTERQAAQRAREALRQMRDLYATDPTAAQTPTSSAVLKGMGRVPVLGGLVSGLTGPAAQRALSPAQQAFQRAAVQLRHNVGALSPHARLQLGFLQDINTAYVPPAGTDTQTISQNFAPEWESLLGQMDDLLGASEPARTTSRATKTPTAPVPQSPASPQASTVNPAKFFRP